MKKYLLISAAFALVMVVGSFWTSARAADDPLPRELSGWGWSSNVGWVSFNGSNHTGDGVTDYRVSVSDSGSLSGYAWSPHIGWISFNQSALSASPACPSQSSPSVDFNSGAVTGWARAYVAIGRTDGWDGCIELSGLNHLSNRSYNGSRGVTYHEETAGGIIKGILKGFSWGGDVIGWLSFAPTVNTVTKVCQGDECPGNHPKVFVSIGADRNQVPVGQHPNITWEGSTNLDSCEGTNFDTDGDIAGTAPGVDQTTAVTYEIECEGSQGNASNSVTVGIAAAALDVDLLIGKVAETADRKSLDVPRGARFGLKWNNNLIDQGYECDPTVSVESWDTGWGDDDGGNATLESFGVPIGSYTFMIYCDKPGFTPQSSSVILNLTSSSLEEI